MRLRRSFNASVESVGQKAARFALPLSKEVTCPDHAFSVCPELSDYAKRQCLSFPRVWRRFEDGLVDPCSAASYPISE
jgi:hypothetical protein